MSPQTFRTINRDDRKTHSVTRSRAHASTVLRHEMTVVASSVADVVASAGGWLYDRRMAGWQVNVLVSDRAGERALQILGAVALDLSGNLEAVSDDPDRAATLVVAADVYAADERVRRFVSHVGPQPRRGRALGRYGAARPERQPGVLPAERGCSGVQGAGAAGRGYSQRYGAGDGSPFPLWGNRSRADGR